jgi:hypothetical protein
MEEGEVKLETAPDHFQLSLRRVSKSGIMIDYVIYRLVVLWV